MSSYLSCKYEQRMSNLETLINKDEKLDKEMQILLPTNFKKIFYSLKN